MNWRLRNHIEIATDTWLAKKVDAELDQTFGGSDQERARYRALRLFEMRQLRHHCIESVYARLSKPVLH